MTGFDFFFSLFGLLLGFSLAEVLGGFGRALNRPQRERIGWLSPMLAAYVMLDITSFWAIAWSLHKYVPATPIVLVGGMVIAALYYLVAVLVWPNHGVADPDFEAHYFAQKARVFGGIILCNLLMALARYMLTGAFGVGWGAVQWAFEILCFVLPAIGIVISTKRASIVLLAAILAVYIAGSIVFSLG